MHTGRLHLRPNQISGGRSASPLVLSHISHTVDANGQISPPLSDYGSIPARPISSGSSLISSSLDLGRSHHQSRSSSKESRHTSLSTGSSHASSLWLQQPRHVLSTINDPEQEIMNLCQLNSNLEEKYKILEAQHETLQDAYNSLLNALRQSGTLKDQENKQDEPVRREDYPGVRFWTRRDWLDRSGQESDTMVLDNSGQRGKARASQGINVAMRYVEDENGTVVNGHRATEMRRYARLIWVHMANNGGLPLSWGKADVKLSQTYCREMRQRFPELALCDLDWKADQIATDNYPSWFKNWSESSQKAQVKHEQEDTSAALNSKRLNTPTPDEPAAKKLKVTDLSGLANMEVNTNSFQIKNSLNVVDASKLTSLATNFISTTIPQNPASSRILPPTAHLPNVNSNLNAHSDHSSRNVASSSGNPMTVGFQTGSHADRDTAVTKACVATSDILIPDVIAEIGSNAARNAATDITMDISSGPALVTSDTTETSATMTMPVVPSKMTSATSVNFVTNMPATIAVPSGMSLATIPTSATTIPIPIVPSGISLATTPTSAMAMSIPVAVPSGMTPTKSNTDATFSAMTMPGKITVPTTSATITANTTTTSLGSSAMNVPSTTIPIPIAVPSGMSSATTPTSATTISIPMAVPSGTTSTNLESNTAATFSAMTMPASGSSAMTMPITMVVPSTITTNVPAAIASSTLPPDCGIGTIAAGPVATKKKPTTKKRITNSNTPKNLCARDWVPAVGGSTEEFDRHWDLLKEEEKNIYVERSKQLRLAALNR